jgi:hypothetical protein
MENSSKIVFRKTICFPESFPEKIEFIFLKNQRGYWEKSRAENGCKYSLLQGFGGAS